jgi:hypothetical protein
MEKKNWFCINEFVLKRKVTKNGFVLSFKK